jgi:hypothetical protein
MAAAVKHRLHVLNHFVEKRKTYLLLVLLTAGVVLQLVQAVHGPPELIQVSSPHPVELDDNNLLNVTPVDDLVDDKNVTSVDDLVASVEDLLTAVDDNVENLVVAVDDGNVDDVVDDKNVTPVDDDNDDINYTKAQGDDNVDDNVDNTQNDTVVAADAAAAAAATTVAAAAYVRTSRPWAPHHFPGGR